jgi:hypothetical protein
MPLLRPSHPLLLLPVLLLISACSDPKIAAYRIAREKPVNLVAPAASPMASGNTGDTTLATAAVPSLLWTAPAHWLAKPVSSVRKGSYAIASDSGATADLSITAFPGDVGGERANLNRWRRQLDLAPLSEGETPADLTRFEHHALAFTVVDFANPAGQPATRLLGAIVPVGSATWFFKLTGPDTLVASEKAAFLAFLKTVRAP